MPSSPLIGREGELEQVGQALADPQFRLVTLTGPPGVGKTRLALTAASAAANRFADGEVFVELANLPRSGSVLEEIARAVGSDHAIDEPEGERLIESLVSRELLLVIDNCEHVLPISGLAALVARCPQLRVLATSRERLHLTAEREIAVEPLPVPDQRELDDSESIAVSPAVQLLVARAQAVRNGFAVTADNGTDVADVCRQLDGLPLALELAAAQLKVFTPGELAYRLRHRSILLAGGLHDMPERHEGLRTTISWSHNLMPDRERTLFRRLAVFVGGWTLPAAEAVCATEDGPMFDVATATTSLVDKSVVASSTRADGVTTFTMLESIREFAAGELAAHGEVESTTRRHAEFYTALAVDAERGIGTPDEQMSWRWLGYEHGNLRAALDYSLGAGDVATALRLAASLGWYWYTRGQVGEGRAIVNRTLDTLDTVGADEAPLAVPLAAALLTAGILAWSQGDLAPALTQLTRSRRLSQDSDDTRRAAVASAFLGHTEREAGNLDAAARHYAKARSIFEHAADLRGIAWSQFDQGMLAWRRDELDEAGRLFADSVDRFRDLGYGWATASAALAFGCIEVRRGSIDAGTRLAVEALNEFDRLWDRRGLAQTVELIAQIASTRGQLEIAGRLLGAAATIRRSLAVPSTANELDVRRRTEHAVQQGLGHERAVRAVVAGQTLRQAGVLALARRVTGVADTGDAGAARPTPREREVAALVATGLTNRQIGRALGIAEKTVEVHVRNVLGKLGAHSRAEIASWAVAHGVYDPERSAS